MDVTQFPPVAEARGRLLARTDLERLDRLNADAVAADEWLASTIRSVSVLVAQRCGDAELVRAWRAYQADGSRP